MSFLLCSVLETWGGTGLVVDAGPASRQLDSGVQSLGCCAVNHPATGEARRVHSDAVGASKGCCTFEVWPA